MSLQRAVLKILFLILSTRWEAFAASSVSIGVGFFTDYNLAVSQNSDNQAEVSALTGERLKIEYRKGDIARGWDFKFSDEVSISQYLKDPDLSLSIPETVYHDIKIGIVETDSTANQFIFGLQIGLKQYPFFSPDNFVDFGVYRLFVPSLVLDGLYRPFYFGSRTRLGFRGMFEVMGPAAGGEVKVSSGYLARGHLSYEKIVDSFVLEINAGSNLSRQSTNIADYERFQNEIGILLWLYFR
jgi:hypothetical protein